MSVLSVMWLELESVSEISSPRWSSVYECQSVECAFTSPVIIELGMLVMWCRGVSWCYVYVGYGDVLEVFCVYFENLSFCVVCECCI